MWKEALIFLIVLLYVLGEHIISKDTPTNNKITISLELPQIKQRVCSLISFFRRKPNWRATMSHYFRSILDSYNEHKLIDKDTSDLLARFPLHFKYPSVKSKQTNRSFKTSTSLSLPFLSSQPLYLGPALPCTTWALQGGGPMAQMVISSFFHL